MIVYKCIYKGRIIWVEVRVKKFKKQNNEMQ